MKTEDLIVELTRSLEPVRPLPSPSVRLARWTAASLSIAAVGVFLIGPRVDISTAIRQPAFAVLAVMALVTAMSSAAAALVLSVPGAERSRAQSGFPFFLASIWALTLTAALIDAGTPMARLLAMPVHVACLIEIAAFAAIPGWKLFAMLRRAAPLRPAWSAALAALAATALGVFATQIVCPLDDPAHHLVGHLLPMAILTIGIATGRRRSIVWLPPRAV